MSILLTGLVAGLCGWLGAELYRWSRFQVEKRRAIRRRLRPFER